MLERGVALVRYDCDKVGERQVLISRVVGRPVLLNVNNERMRIALNVHFGPLGKLFDVMNS